MTSQEKTWTDCPTCHYPLLGERCDNPGCRDSGNVPPAILERRAKEEAEAAERERFSRITATSYEPTQAAADLAACPSPSADDLQSLYELDLIDQDGQRLGTHTPKRTMSDAEMRETIRQMLKKDWDAMDPEKREVVLVAGAHRVLHLLATTEA
jgi:hypothetical protein